MIAAKFIRTDLPAYAVRFFVTFVKMSFLNIDMILYLFVV